MRGPVILLLSLAFAVSDAVVSHERDRSPISCRVGSHEVSSAASNKANSVASADYGFDVSSWLTAGTSSMDGWDDTGSKFWVQSTYGGSTGSYVNGSANLTLPFIEYWLPYSALSDDELSETLDYLPAGTYTLQADMIATWQYNWIAVGEVSGVSLFAGGESITARTGDGVPERYTVKLTTDSQGSVKWGVSISSTNANWVAIDNPALYLNCGEEELLLGERAKVAAELADYYSDEEIRQKISAAEAAGTTATEIFDSLETLRKSVSSLPKKDPLSKGLSDITINGHSIVYDETNNIYYATIPLNGFLSGEYSAQVSYRAREGWTSLTIDNETVDSGTAYTFKNIEAEKTYSLSVANTAGSATVAALTFTSLPIVSMNDGTITDDYSEGTIIIVEPDNADQGLFAMKVKTRGGITNQAGKHKRNYHVKFIDDNGDKENHSFFGLRNDNSWILEANQVDMSRCRNRVLTDLWNDFATKPYYSSTTSGARTGTRGKFVELILNGEYRGIYTMYENMDRRQLQLMKTDKDSTMHGRLWKSKDWSYAVFMGHDSDKNYYPGTSPSNYSNYSSMWNNYECKYPDLDDVLPTDWSPLYDAVDFVCTSDDHTFNTNFVDYFDYMCWRDYYILMELCLSSDNHGKNIYFVIYNQQNNKRITPAVWDMDATLGQMWSDYYYHASFLGPEQDYANFITTYEHGDYNLFRRMRNANPENFNMDVRKRYRDLRKTKFDTDSIINRFHAYIDEWQTCGAAARESRRWSYDSDISGYALDFDTEMAYLTDWITRRLNYLDNTRFKISELPSDISEKNVPEVGLFTVYAVDGTLIRRQKDTDISDLPPGIYIVNGRKKIR